MAQQSCGGPKARGGDGEEDLVEVRHLFYGVSNRLPTGWRISPFCRIIFRVYNGAFLISLLFCSFYASVIHHPPNQAKYKVVHE